MHGMYVKKKRQRCLDHRSPRQLPESTNTFYLSVLENPTSCRALHVAKTLNN